MPSTKQKKRMRIWVGLVLLAAMIAIFLLGWFVYYVMTGSWGFGIGDEEQFLRGWFSRLSSSLARQRWRPRRPPPGPGRAAR